MSVLSATPFTTGALARRPGRSFAKTPPVAIFLEFDRLIREEGERHLNELFADFYDIAQEMIREHGAMVPALIAALVQAAKKISKDHAYIVEEDFFSECLQDVLEGGDGLRVGRYAPKDGD